MNVVVVVVELKAKRKNKTCFRFTKRRTRREGHIRRYIQSSESSLRLDEERNMSKKNPCVGIVREVYDKWERRAPLCPVHVQELVKKGIEVVVQPSNRRIFSNEEYAQAGAIVTDDLTAANVVLGVKQVPKEKLLPEKTYMFFSHVIKAQPENMELLDAILKNRIRLIDYECIKEKGSKNGKRLVAFGMHAGRAGMINGFRGLGERLINKGYSTPFVNVASAYMYADLEEAKHAVEKAGRMIKSNGIPPELSPMTFVFTGNGNVSKGAQEIFKLMPHQFVHPSELASLPKDRRTLYGTVARDDFLVQNKNPSVQFGRKDYYQHPFEYEPVFHQRVLPHSSMIINGMYWDDRFPPLITKDQISEAWENGKNKLLGIADITCDIGGSIEFLERDTSIEKPFFLYDVENRVVKDSLDGDGVLMMGVSILPSELPREASMHFGNQLLEYVKELSEIGGSPKLLNSNTLSKEIYGACITSNGVLTSEYEYIHRMRAERERSRKLGHSLKVEENAGSTCLLLEGHLFDTGLINNIFNLIEKENGGFCLLECDVKPNFFESDSTRSTALVQISMNSREDLDRIIDKVKSLSDLTSGSEASISEVRNYCGTNYSQTQTQISKLEGPSMGDTKNLAATYGKKKRIVCLGAGLVAGPLVEYLSRGEDHEVVIVSSIANEAQNIAKKFLRPNITPKTINVSDDASKIDSLIEQSDCVVSLLPATMHASIAKSCIQLKKPLVTASYISPEMRALDDDAKKANIPILGELGLDPGMDHMSAMKVIDGVKSNGGKIVSFSSVCGGLPAPEAADNALGYKFSWSPRGVLTAALNPAIYKKGGEIIKVAGEDLLNTAERVHFLPAFSLEQIPNRNSLPYADVYGIADVQTIFRGTLRYAGCCNILYQLRRLGFLDAASPVEEKNWGELVQSRIAQSGLKLDENAESFVQWLGLFSDQTPITNRASTLDAFCDVLQKKLAYAPGERDMAIMHHEFGIEYANGEAEKRTSTFVGYGNKKGETIMAKTVGMSAAIGVELILEKKLQETGVLTPTTPDIYIPALAKLEAEDVHFIEKIVSC